MRNLDLNSYGVQEMNVQEVKQVEGGIWGLVLLVNVAALALMSKKAY